MWEVPVNQLPTSQFYLDQYEAFASMGNDIGMECLPESAGDAEGTVKHSPHRHLGAVPSVT